MKGNKEGKGILKDLDSRLLESAGGGAGGSLKETGGYGEGK